MIVADEAGLADDPSVLRLLAAAETAGAKVVMVGNHRQFGAVRSGGSLEALVGRHGDGVHILGEDVRQIDGDERVALGELRAGTSRPPSSGTRSSIGSPPRPYGRVRSMRRWQRGRPTSGPDGTPRCWHGG